MYCCFSIAASAQHFISWLVKLFLIFFNLVIHLMTYLINWLLTLASYLWMYQKRTDKYIVEEMD